MTAWLLSFGWNWALVPVAAWLARRFWLATREPGLKYLDHSTIGATPPRVLPFTIKREHLFLLESWVNHFKYPSLHKDVPPQPQPFVEPAQASHLLQVSRREGMFPWRRFTETWLVTLSKSVRESDGLVADATLHGRFAGMIAVALARKEETEELAK